MKKLALVLGSLLLVATTVSAKEVVAAPVETVEPVVVVAPPVFVPTGSLDLQYKIYGEPEHSTDTIGDYGRIQLQGNAQFTENNNFKFRYRGYNTLHTLSELYDTTDDVVTRGASADELRLEHYYNFGYLGDSKVKLVNRVRYYHYTNNRQKAEESLRFNFADYFGFMPTWFTNDYFEIAPKIGGNWGTPEDMYYGVDIMTWWKLPAGFEVELNAYNTWNDYKGNSDYRDGDGNLVDKNYTFDAEAYLYYTLGLWKSADERTKIGFYFEGGMDPWTSNTKIDFDSKDDFDDYMSGIEGSRRNDHNSYSAYFQPEFNVSHKLNAGATVYAGAGAEYRNFKITDEASAQDWRWRPFVYAGLKTKF